MSYSRVQSFTFTKDAELPKVPPPFLVDGILHRSQTILFGQTNVGKSMISISLAVAVASGRKWCGRMVHNPGPVTIVSGDPDGLFETYNRLDKVREDLGDGLINIVVPERPLAEETWFEVGNATEGSRLMILDNLTQFVPGTLSDDYAVKVVYEKLQTLARRGTSICVLAHTSDHRNEQGYAPSIPSGSFVIRSVPRWFVYLKRANGVLTMSMSGNSGGRPWELILSEPTDTPRFEVLEDIPPDELAERRGKRNRSKTKLDRWAEYRAYAEAHPELTQRALAEHFHVSVGTINNAVHTPKTA